MDEDEGESVRREVVTKHETLLESVDLTKLLKQTMEYYVERGNVVM